MQRRSFAHRMATVAVLVLGLCWAAACGSAPEGPIAGCADSVILVSLDTLRADSTGVYGCAFDTTPELDALAADSIVFEHAYAQASWTQPSHQSLFQSRLASRTDDKGPVLAQAMTANGLATVAFTGGGHLSKKFGFDRGFQRYEEEKVRVGFSHTFPLAEQWLRASSQEPFFLFLHTYDIHEPYDPPPPFDTMFCPDYTGDLTGQGVHEVFKKVVKARKEAREGGEAPDFATLLDLDDADRRAFRAFYDGGVRYTDQYIGNLVRLLKELGLWDRVALVLFSDHGEEFWDHGSIGHGHNVNQELVWVPLVIHLPGDRLGGTRVGQTVRLLDVAPTLLELVGKPAYEPFMGQSLVPLMEGSASDNLPVVSESSGYKTIIRFPWKYIVYADQEERYLYDLTADPREQHSVIDQHPELADELHRQLRAMLDDAAATRVEFDPDAIQDEELREQLKALGYIE